MGTEVRPKNIGSTSRERGKVMPAMSQADM